MTVPTCVFVYGTLMPGERNSAVAGVYRRAEAARLPDHLLLDLRPEGYPALVARPGAEPVHGVLLHYTPEEWASVCPQLDRLEGTDETPPLYRRVQVQVETDAGMRQAWVYLYARPERMRQPGCTPLPTGCWTAAPDRFTPEPGQP
ncbi:gamma-glutamylcyclotransferase family protein [Deinococcus sonorensis]|uniref:Putative gamma-glutamylcyclotransferase n=2 Tax=Deinococcus sonorensis TaxID=309891 RepID=A0AAU7UD47_9DEIO